MVETGTLFPSWPLKIYHDIMKRNEIFDPNLSLLILQLGQMTYTIIDLSILFISQ